MTGIMRRGAIGIASKRGANDALTSLHEVFGVDAAVISETEHHSVSRQEFFDYVATAKNFEAEIVELDAWVSGVKARYASIYHQAIKRDRDLTGGVFPLTQLANPDVIEMACVLQHARQDMRPVVSLLVAMQNALEQKVGERSLWLLAQRVTDALSIVALQLRLAKTSKTMAEDVVSLRPTG